MLSKLHRHLSVLVAAGLSVGSAGAQDQQAQPFQLGVTQSDYVAPAASSVPKYSSYPQFVAPVQQKPPQQKPLNAGVAKAAPPPVQRPLNAGVARTQPPAQPLQAGISAPPGVLPAEFLGQWQVMGSKSGLEALPQFREEINRRNIFQATTANTWTIQGNPQQGYTITSDSGVSTQLFVDKVQNGTAFIRYQHQINNTFAQEAIVMQLNQGGRQFTGLERISIVKPGEPAPRCKVTYQLMGTRLR